MNKLVRLIGLSLVLVLAMSLGLGVVSAQDDDVIVIGWEQEPSQLQPLSEMAFATYLTDFYQRDVWDWDTDVQIYPVMVEEIPTVENGLVTTTEDGKTQVTYNLREGMLWSDGEEINTEDCAFNHLLYSDISTGDFQRGTYLEVVESFEVVDDYTFVLTYNGPFPDYLSAAPATCALPEHVLGPFLEENGTINEAPFFRGEGVVGYAPYILSEWNVGEGFIFELNPNWGANEWETVPEIERVITRTITETAQMRNALEVGDIDLAFNFSQNEISSYRELEDVEVWSTAGEFQDALWINMNPDGDQHPALKDVNVRRAIAHALNREQMLIDLFGEGLFVPPNYYHPNWVPEDLAPIPYDVDEANRLLDEAGWIDTDGDGIRDDGDGFQLVFRYYTTTRQDRQDYQLLIQSYLNEVGIGTQLLPVPSTILFASFNERGIISTGDFDLTQFALSYEGRNPNVSTFWFACDAILTPDGGNGYGFCSPRWDELHEDLIPFETDPELRAEYVEEAVRLMDEAVFWVGLFPRTTQYAVRADRFDAESMVGMGVNLNYFNQVENWVPTS